MRGLSNIEVVRPAPYLVPSVGYLGYRLGDKCSYSCTVSQRCKNVRLQATQGNKFCIWASNIFGYLVRNVLYGTHISARILRWFRDVWKIRAPLE
jgi:hypothetical protein